MASRPRRSAAIEATRSLFSYSEDHGIDVQEIIANEDCVDDVDSEVTDEDDQLDIVEQEEDDILDEDYLHRLSEDSEGESESEPVCTNAFRF